jgi:hypothetical protein
MITASVSELKLHFAILERRPISFEELSNTYSDHLFSCLNRWYGQSLLHDVTLAHEAVYETFRHYYDRPRKFNTEQGSLKVYLEICADRTMQHIFQREGIEFKVSSIRHVLARHFDNERDMEFARLLLKGKGEIPVFVNLLGIGSYRIDQQLLEVARHIKRVSSVLEMNKLSAKRRRQKSKTKQHLWFQR